MFLIDLKALRVYRTEGGLIEFEKNSLIDCGGFRRMVDRGDGADIIPAQTLPGFMTPRLIRPVGLV
jgi:hypothetical protein